MDFLHAIGPWVLLLLGVINLLQVTVFYQGMQQLGDKVTDSKFVKRRLEDSAFKDLFRQFSKWNLYSPSSRIFAALWGIALIAAAGVWFCFRP